MVVRKNLGLNSEDGRCLEVLKDRALLGRELGDEKLTTALLDRLSHHARNPRHQGLLLSDPAVEKHLVNPDRTTRNRTAAAPPLRAPQRRPAAEAAGAAENRQTSFPQLPQPLLLLTQGDRREKTRVHSTRPRWLTFQTLGGSLSERCQQLGQPTARSSTPSTPTAKRRAAADLVGGVYGSLSVPLLYFFGCNGGAGGRAFASVASRSGGEGAAVLQLDQLLARWVLRSRLEPSCQGLAQ